MPKIKVSIMIESQEGDIDLAKYLTNLLTVEKELKKTVNSIQKNYKEYANKVQDCRDEISSIERFFRHNMEELKRIETMEEMQKKILLLTGKVPNDPSIMRVIATIKSDKECQT